MKSPPNSPHGKLLIEFEFKPRSKCFKFGVPAFSAYTRLRNLTVTSVCPDQAVASERMQPGLICTVVSGISIVTLNGFTYFHRTK